jgi:hypothetical protein
LRPLVAPFAGGKAVVRLAVVVLAAEPDPPESERATITAASPAAPITAPTITGRLRMLFMAPTMAAAAYSPEKPR